jgi:hypothetical protein
MFTLFGTETSNCILQVHDLQSLMLLNHIVVYLLIKACASELPLGGMHTSAEKRGHYGIYRQKNGAGNTGGTLRYEQIRVLRDVR